MSHIDRIIRSVEKMGDYSVLDIYDFDEDSYLVTAENKATGDIYSDFIFKVEKNSFKVSHYLPSANLSEYREKIKKAKVLYSA